MYVWSCAFWPHPRPLIAQPLIAESTQLFDYVTRRAWLTGYYTDGQVIGKKLSFSSILDTFSICLLGNRSEVLATATGWVEQQGASNGLFIPLNSIRWKRLFLQLLWWTLVRATNSELLRMISLIHFCGCRLGIPFPTEFFQWLVTRLLVHTGEIAYYYGADWSVDKTWYAKKSSEIFLTVEIYSLFFRCRAARNYSIEVLKWSNESVPCAIITGLARFCPVHILISIIFYCKFVLSIKLAANTSVHHLNTRTMRDKRTNRSQFRARARKVMDRYQSLFPNW